MSSGPILHGGGLAAAIAEYGGEPAQWLDLSTGINPRGYPAGGISSRAWGRLPDSDGEAKLLAAARGFYAIGAGCELIAAPGTQALIEALPRQLLGTTATIVAPAAGTYREHAHCCAKAGRTVRDVIAPADVADDETLAILVRPNNPDGSIAPRQDVIELAARLAANGGRLIIDEAFCDTVHGESLIAHRPDNAIILRSFGKFFGMAGLRLGFAIADAQTCSRLRDWFGPWAVSGPALEIGAQALADHAWIDKTRKWLQNRSRAMVQCLEANGMEIAGRHELFVLARTGAATDVWRRLQRHHVLVRHFPDRPGLLRFGLCATIAELKRLAEALQQTGGRR